MSGLLATLPLHLACQLISTGNPVVGNVTIVEDTSAPKFAAVLPTGYTAFPDIEVAYKYYDNRLPWNSARKQCMVEGGSLAIVDSFKKIGYLMGLNNKQGIHTGIHRSFDNTEWTNVKTGQSLGFIPWKPDANLSAGTGICVAMWFDGSGVGPWDCSKALPAVCEIPMFKNHISEPEPVETQTTGLRAS